MIEIYYKTDAGRIKSNNEDSIVVLRLNRGNSSENIDVSIFLVADGAGGHATGEIASYLANRTLATYLVSNILYPPNADKEDIVKLLSDGITYANKSVINYVKKNPASEGMGTTIVAAVVCGKKMVIGHVGDSRAYRIYNDSIVQLTKDHSLIQDLIDNGKITKEEARIHPKKNVIFRAIGANNDIEADIQTIYLYQDDIILLCSDGLTDMLTDSEIKNIVVNGNDTLQEKCNKLVDSANKAGGNDNISVVLFKVNNIPSRKDILGKDTYIDTSPSSQFMPKKDDILNKDTIIMESESHAIGINIRLGKYLDKFTKRLSRSS